MITFILILVIGTLSFGAGIIVHHTMSINYKKRWLTSTRALNATLAVNKATKAKGGVPQIQESGAKSSVSQKQLYRMESWDRRDLELARAKEGLPQRDSLEGMESWDIKAVLKAHDKGQRLAT